MVKNSLIKKINKVDKSIVGIIIVSVTLFLVVLTLALRKCKREGFALLQLADASWVTKGQDGAQGAQGEKYTLTDEDINSIVDRVYTDVTNKKDDKENPLFENPKNYLDILPEGTILMWGYNEVPRGWARCNGKNGTIDLRGRIPRGLTKVEVHYYRDNVINKDICKNVGDKGGHDITGLWGGTYAGRLNFNTTDQWSSATLEIYQGGQQPSGNKLLHGVRHPNVPPYTAVQFIQKLPKEEYSADKSGRVDGYRNLEEEFKFDYIENDKLPHNSNYKYPEGY